jgi:hypothetical protein
MILIGIPEGERTTFINKMWASVESDFEHLQLWKDKAKQNRRQRPTVVIPPSSSYEYELSTQSSDGSISRPKGPKSKVFESSSDMFSSDIF